MTLQDINGRYKQINNFPDYYITEYGEVYSIRLRGKEKEPHIHKLTPKNPKRSSGYSNVVLCNDKGQFTRMIHRLVAEHFVEGYFEGAVVNHIDGNNRNNVASNLEWTTVKDNIHKSYITSGVTAKRNSLIWTLIDPAGEEIGEFGSHSEMELFIKHNNIDTAPTQLVKHRQSRGFSIKTRKAK
jgi:hypothetical protein